MKPWRPWVRKKIKAGVDPEPGTDSAKRFPPDEPDDRGDRAARVWAVLSRLFELAIKPRRRNGKGKGKDITAGLDVVMRLEGDEPAQQRLATVTLDTQCDRMNLMSLRVWRRLNEGRGALDRVDDVAVRTLGSERIGILGIVRGVEWRFRGGSKTYKSDFYVADIGGFDVLVGSETILRYDLLRPGSDLERYFNENER
ncbi:hypothetical protein ASPVEDRAFT_145412 [Aspergillus versicolor CBS 583.65]|uniref:Uncharacterized protein n=1 Tax=Aspergillus versicolor CBS 583.65 TaxID=1036611 RepID=A0A1L9P308_ASPVE|nr:uncharacterized protein ASPVEDRAFT_145412 [Aspergillus versicolor CBS 583.65]OJI95876.1 hypothetical protein ASPVEDRAFT_145412 [Aspergillus versicolor CBS 583.65]